MFHIEVVDEQDRVVGLADRRYLRPVDIFRVSALWIEDSSGLVLLARRSLSKTVAPGKWGPAVTGTVEPGETYRECIIREACEELGLLVEPIRLHKEYVQAASAYFLQWFSTILPADAVLMLESSEVIEVEWISKDELIARLTHAPETFLTAVDRFAVAS
jgi:isopentenyldiphosphate isomerase